MRMRYLRAEHMAAYGCGVKFPRSSGILLHPTSLPGRFGVGDLGPGAMEFANFLTEAGQKLWQVLPLNPTGYGDSPYQCFSAFAGNPMLISLERLKERGLLTAEDLKDTPEFTADAVDFGRAIPFKMRALKRAAGAFLANPQHPDRLGYEAFCRQEAGWLDDFALFMAVKEAHGGVAWTAWEPEIRARRPEAIARWREQLRVPMEAIRFWQFEFFRQWRAIKGYCNERGIRVMGDVPIYVAHDSAEVWAAPEEFFLEPDGRPTVVSGVPPDYFSATGQLWGNPIYRWERMQANGFRWWKQRLRAAFGLFDLVRLDHFRGFEAFWEVPGTERTAMHGRWVKAPGMALFEALAAEFGELAIVAENLGVITGEVEAMRARFHLPGMSILQFAFGTDAQGPSFRPHNYARDTVAYTGSHDNDTAMGWWLAGAGNSTRTQEEVDAEKAMARAYLNLGEGDEVNWAMIRAVESSVATTVIVPAQDILGLGSEARMNLPGSMAGNWKWRMRPGALKPEHAARLKQMAVLFDR
jgi:4-alpha-glucanotransferase